MPRKKPYVAVSPSGDFVLIPAHKKFGSVVLVEDYDEWLQDPLNVASYVIESKIQIDMLVTAITEEAEFELEKSNDGVLMTFRFANGLTLAVPAAHEGDTIEIEALHDFVALPHGVLQCEVSIEVVPQSPRVAFEHGEN
jgi:hypothetical protein